MNRKRTNISESAKDIIVYNVTNKLMSVTELANLHNCHPKTINRVMAERGVSAAPTNAKIVSDTARVKKILTEANITMDQLSQLTMLLMRANLTNPDHLQNVLTHHVITPANVQRFLNQCSKEELATIFYATGLVKVAEITQKAMEERKAKTAALFKQPAQVPTSDAAVSA